MKKYAFQISLVLGIIPMVIYLTEVILFGKGDLYVYILLYAPIPCLIMGIVGLLFAREAKKTSDNTMWLYLINEFVIGVAILMLMISAMAAIAISNGA